MISSSLQNGWEERTWIQITTVQVEKKRYQKVIRFHERTKGKDDKLESAGKSFIWR